MPDTGRYSSRPYNGARQSTRPPTTAALIAMQPAMPAPTTGLPVVVAAASAASAATPATTRNAFLASGRGATAAGTGSVSRAMGQALGSDAKSVDLGLRDAACLRVRA